MPPSMQSPALKSRPFLTHQVVAIMDEPEHVASALSQLERKGFDGGDIKVLSGVEGAYWLDATSGSLRGSRRKSRRRIKRCALLRMPHARSACRR